MFRLLCAVFFSVFALLGQPAQASSPRGSISIVNERPEAVEVSIGGKERGKVQAHSRRAFSARVGTR